MALTKTTENDKIEIVNRWNIQVRKATIVKEDGTEISRTFKRKILVPGSIDGSDNWTETDISGEDADVQAICNAVWTTTLKNEFKQNLIDKKPV
jgi:hypothetical protein